MPSVTPLTHLCIGKGAILVTREVFQRTEISAVFGLTLCLEFVAPTGNLGLNLGTAAGFYGALSLGSPARAPALGMEPSIMWDWLIVVMSSPGPVAAGAGTVPA